MALWRLRSGVLFTSTRDPGGGAERVEPEASATTMGAEVLPVDEVAQAVDEVDGPGEHADEGTAPKRPAKSADKAAWLAYVVALGEGYGPGLKATKAELIALADAQDGIDPRDGES